MLPNVMTRDISPQALKILQRGKKAILLRRRVHHVGFSLGSAEAVQAAEALNETI
jgi:hypothetical protein